MLLYFSLIKFLFLFVLIVNIPKITRNPESWSVATGGDVIFRVEAVGDDLEFQWQKDDIDIDSNESRLCCNRTRDSSTLHIQHTKKEDKGRYSCVVKNPCEISGRRSLEADLSVCKFVNMTIRYIYCKECVKKCLWVVHLDRI